MIRDPARRRLLAAGGEARVRREFDMQRGIAVLAALFGLPERQPEQQPESDPTSALAAAD
jgi:hypothetical protein